MTETYIDENGNTKIAITYDGETYSIDVDLMQSYYENASTFLRAMDRAQEQFKAEVAAFAETTSLPKGFVSKLFKLTYDGKIASEEARVEALKTLSDALNPDA